MSKYLCWNCGLWQGDEQDDLESSKLCPACKKAIEAGSKQPDTRGLYEAEEADNA